MYVSNFRYEIPFRMGSPSQLHMFPGNETTVTTQQRFVKYSFFHTPSYFIHCDNQSVETEG